MRERSASFWISRSLVRVAAFIKSIIIMMYLRISPFNPQYDHNMSTAQNQLAQARTLPLRASATWRLASHRTSLCSICRGKTAEYVVSEWGIVSNGDIIYYVYLNLVLLSTRSYYSELKTKWRFTGSQLQQQHQKHPPDSRMVGHLMNEWAPAWHAWLSHKWPPSVLAWTQSPSLR